MSRVIAAYDLDEDHGRVWVNAYLKRMPDIVIVANQSIDRAQTVTYVPEARLLEAMDAAREAGRQADMAERVAADHKRLCDSLKETNDDLRRIIDELRETEGPADENAKLRDLCEWLLEPYRLGAVTGEGVDRQWCRETYDGGSYRLHELGAEVEK